MPALNVKSTFPQKSSLIDAQSVSTLPGGVSTVGLCMHRRQWEQEAVGRDRCPPAGGWRGAGAAEEAQGPQRGTLKGQCNGPDSAQVSQHSDEHTANTLDGSCYLSKPVVNKWNLLALIVGEPQASKPPGALQLLIVPQNCWEQLRHFTSHHRAAAAHPCSLP